MHLTIWTAADDAGQLLIWLRRLQVAADANAVAVKVNGFDCVAIVGAAVGDACAVAAVADATLSDCGEVNAFVAAAVVVASAWISCVFCI